MRIRKVSCAMTSSHTVTPHRFKPLPRVYYRVYEVKDYEPLSVTNGTTFIPNFINFRHQLTSYEIRTYACHT
jgi:hypothetical protein